MDKASLDRLLKALESEIRPLNLGQTILFNKYHQPFLGMDADKTSDQIKRRLMDEVCVQMSNNELTHNFNYEKPYDDHIYSFETFAYSRESLNVLIEKAFTLGVVTAMKGKNEKR